MAEYGLKVWNKDGFVQIDGTYRNLGLRAKGSVYSGGVSSSTGFFIASVTLPAAAPMLAWRATAPTVQRQIVQSGAQITYYFECQGSGVRVDYWLFDFPDFSIMPGNYGLRVWNAGGEVVFDSRAKYMRVVDSLQALGAGAVGDPIDNGISRAYSVGTIAVVQSLLRYDISSNPIEPGPKPRYLSIYKAAGVRFDGVAALTYGMYIVNSIEYESGDTSAPPPQAQSGYGYLVLDVSNY